MGNIKNLIVSGCSFTYDQDEPSWATYLHESLKSQWEKIKYTNYARVSAGNGYISRSLLYGVHKAMQIWPTDELLVGVMWSGSARHDVFQYFVDDHEFTKTNTINPVGFIENNDKWIIMNHHWKDKYSTNYYKHYYDAKGSYISTMEHILRIQWFLKNHNIKYFMTNFAPTSLPDDECKNDPNIKYLYDMVDWTHFLPVKSCMEWCVNDSEIEGKNDSQFSLEARHPSTKQHAAFRERVIIPHLKNMGYID